MLNLIWFRFQVRIAARIILILGFSFLGVLGCDQDELGLTATLVDEIGEILEPIDPGSDNNINDMDNPLSPLNPLSPTNPINVPGPPPSPIDIVAPVGGGPTTTDISALKRTVAERISTAEVQYQGNEILEVSVASGNPDFSVNDQDDIIFSPQEKRGEKARLRKVLMQANTDDGKTHKFFYFAIVNSGHGTNGDTDGDGKVDDVEGNNVQDKTSDFSAGGAANSISILSPGGVNGNGDKVEVTVSLVSSQLLYAVSYKNSGGNTVKLLAESKLGLNSGGHSTYPNFFTSVKVNKVRTASYYEKWNPIWGEDDEIENWFNELVVTIVPRSVADANIKEHHKLDIIFRVYDDGLGFRYRIRGLAADSGSNANSFRINQRDEKTTFNFPNSTGTNWPNVLYGRSRTRTGTLGHGPAEVNILNESLSNASESESIFTPISMKSSNNYFVSIHEAGLTPKEMASMVLKKNRGNRFFTVEFTSENVFQHNAGPGFENKSRASKPFIMPWRTIQVVKGNAGKLIDSRLILNLNDPLREDIYRYNNDDPSDPLYHDFEPTFDKVGERGNGSLDLSWMRPARYVGYWRGVHEQERPVPGHDKSYCFNQCANTEFILDYYKMADETNAGSVLFEGWQDTAGWGGGRWNEWRFSDGRFRTSGFSALAGGTFDFSLMFDTLLAEIPRSSFEEFNVNYRRIQSGKLPIYHVLHTECLTNTANLHKDLLGTRGRVRGDNVPLFEEHRKESHGHTRYLKAGYVAFALAYAHWAQRATKHWHIYIKEAAKNKMNIVVHEPIKATGVRRTYPNMMSREGLHGEEHDYGTIGRVLSTEHHSEVVYQRGLAGPIDWTPGIFTSQTTVTNSKQLALMSALYAPLVMAAELKARQRDPQYSTPMEFIKGFHPHWSESKVLLGEFAKYVVIARRRRDSLNWVVAGFTDNASRTVNIEFNKFLEPEAIYEADIYEDVIGRPRDVRKRQIARVLHGDTTSITMSSRGGFVMNVNYVMIKPGLVIE